MATHPVSVTTETTWPWCCKGADVQKGLWEPPDQHAAPISVTAADSSAPQTPAEIKEVISETLERELRSLRTFHYLSNCPQTDLSESETTEGRCFVLPQCWELFALFSRQLKKLLNRLEDFFFERRLIIHPRRELVQREISARDISLCEWKIITTIKVWKFTLQFKAPTQPNFGRCVLIFSLSMVSQLLFLLYFGVW